MSAPLYSNGKPVLAFDRFEHPELSRRLHLAPGTLKKLRPATAADVAGHMLDDGCRHALWVTGYACDYSKPNTGLVSWPEDVDTLVLQSQVAALRWLDLHRSLNATGTTALAQALSGAPVDWVASMSMHCYLCEAKWRNFALICLEAP